MAILAALLAFGSKYAGKVVTTALGWASTLLFGRVPASRQILLTGITFGSVIWIVLLAGVLFPGLGTFLLLLVPPQGFIPEWVIRLVMLIGAVGVRPSSRDSVPMVCASCESRASISRRCSPSASYSLIAEASADR